MFGRSKKKEKTSGKLNNLLMGAVIGGAIGSVIGASLKAKVDKEAAEAERLANMKKESKKGFLKKLFNKEEEEETRKIPQK